MSTWSYFILGIVSASVVWMPTLWWVLNQRDVARWEASHLRVCKCRERLRGDLRSRVRFGDEVA